MTLASVSPPGPSGVPRRPAWHFVPPSGWMNDPNGLVLDGDTYHLFYQHNPDDTVWGNIHWGHATSTDLVTWRHHPIALWPDEHGLPFSGCVVEHDDAWVAVYTADLDREQSQCLAVSDDRGETWRGHRANPVLRRPDDAPIDFRDPKVVRLDDGAPEGPWLMLLAVGTEVWLYRSPDLVEWSRVATHRPLPDRPGIVLEVPDLVRLRADDGTEHDVLLFSVIPARGDSPTRSVFFQVGALAGDGFIADGPPRPVDEGPSFYAAVCWPQHDDGSTAMIGWMNETASVSARGGDWCGRQSIARTLSLTASPEGYGLQQAPIVPPLRERRVELVAGSSSLWLDEPAVISLPDRPGLVVQLGSFRAAIVDGPTTGVRLESVDGDGSLELAPGSTLRLVVDSGSVEVFGPSGPSASFVTDADLPGHLVVDAPDEVSVTIAQGEPT